MENKKNILHALRIIKATCSKTQLENNGSCEKCPFYDVECRIRADYPDHWDVAMELPTLEKAFNKKMRRYSY